MLNKKCFVLDLDGTVYLGDIPIQETVDFILRHWDTIDFHFLSNNTSKAPTTYVNKLTRMGIPATLDRILSPVTPLIQDPVTKAVVGVEIERNGQGARETAVGEIAVCDRQPRGEP